MDNFRQFLTVMCPPYDSGGVLSFHIFILKGLYYKRKERAPVGRHIPVYFRKKGSQKSISLVKMANTYKVYPAPLKKFSQKVKHDSSNSSKIDTLPGFRGWTCS